MDRPPIEAVQLPHLGDEIVLGDVGRKAPVDGANARLLGGAHDLAGIRLPDAAGMAAEEPQLELLRELERDRALDEDRRRPLAFANSNPESNA